MLVTKCSVFTANPRWNFKEIFHTDTLVNTGNHWGLSNRGSAFAFFWENRTIEEMRSTYEFLPTISTQKLQYVAQKMFYDAEIRDVKDGELMAWYSVSFYQQRGISFRWESSYQLFSKRWYVCGKQRRFSATHAFLRGEAIDKFRNAYWYWIRLNSIFCGELDNFWKIVCNYCVMYYGSCVLVRDERFLTGDVSVL